MLALASAANALATLYCSTKGNLNRTSRSSLLSMAHAKRNASDFCHAATDAAAFAMDQPHVLHASVPVTYSAASTGLATTRAVIVVLRAPSDAAGAVTTVENALYPVVLRATAVCAIGDAHNRSRVVTSAQASVEKTVLRKSSATNAAMKT
jgi:hypothetical protein